MTSSATTSGIQTPNASARNADVVDRRTGKAWVYTDIVKDHFFKPRNLRLDDDPHEADGADWSEGSGLELAEGNALKGSPRISAPRTRLIRPTRGLLSLERFPRDPG